jgi:hypothetical protein
VQNATVHGCSQELLPFLSCYILYPATLLHPLFFQPPALNIAICFFVYLLFLLFPNSYTTLLWESYFLPFSLHVQTNVIYLEGGNRVPRGVWGGSNPLRNSEVVTKLSRIPSSVENTFEKPNKNTGFTHLQIGRNP